MTVDVNVPNRTFLDDHLLAGPKISSKNVKVGLGLLAHGLHYAEVLLPKKLQGKKRCSFVKSVFMTAMYD